MAPDAPILHDDLFTAGVDPKPTKPSNIAKVVTFRKGDAEAGFKDADVIVEGRYTTQPVHQAYIEPHACLATYAPDGQVQIHSSSQGHFMVRAYTAKLLGIALCQHPGEPGRDRRRLRRQDAGLPGAGGGRAVEEVRPHGEDADDAGGRVPRLRSDLGRDDRGQARRQEGRHDRRREAGAEVPGRARSPGSPIGPGCMCGFAMYDLPNVDVVGYDVVSNRPKVAAYRAPGAPITSFAVESAMDELAIKLGIDALTLREKNAAKNGTKTHYGPTHQNIGFTAVLDAVKSHPHWKSPLKEGQGRGLATGFWFNIGGESTAQVHVNEDGSVTAATGSPDIGGSRASIGMMVAEVLGVPATTVRTIVADTGVDRLHPSDRRVAGDVRHRHGGDAGGREGGRRPEEACRADLGNPGRGGGVEGRQGVSGRFQRRCVRAVGSGDAGAEGGPHGWSDQSPRCRSTRRVRVPASARISATCRWTRKPAT